MKGTQRSQVLALGLTALLLGATGCDQAQLSRAELALSASTQGVVAATQIAPSSRPEQPTIQRELAPIQGGQFMAPTIPPMRTSADGRVALNMKRIGPKVGFFLFAPERLTAPLIDSPAGTEILASNLPFQGGLDDDLFHASSVPEGMLTHMTLCDGTPEWPADGEKTNPSACGIDGDHDCYALTMVSIWDQGSAPGDAIELWGTPVTVKVAHPKSAQATIVSIDVGTPVLGATWDVQAFFEPMVTRDGRLFTGRIGNSTLTWTRGPGDVLSHVYDIVYAVAPESASPCDVSAFAELLPLSHAPYDSDMVGRYGIAEYPFRDPEGKLIPNGADLQANYPWVDRDGDNLFMTTVSATLYYEDPTTGAVRTRYPAACAPGAQCQPPATGAAIFGYEPNTDTRGIAMAGLWTRGKMVMLDSSINNTDYGLKNGDDYHRMINLYSPTAAVPYPSTAVRVGSGRDNSGIHAPAGAVDNTTFIDSTENLFNHHPYLQPVTLRDVVWTMNTGRGSAEVAFDDYLSPHAFILSSMNGALSHSGGYNAASMTYHDGFHQAWQSLGYGFVRDVKLQNAATSLGWDTPAHGLAHGDVRLEPVALGGVHGKGFWLDGASGVSYEVGVQAQKVAKHPWFVGLFLDSRFEDDDTIRRVMTWPDGSSVALEGRAHVLLRAPSGETVRRFTLPQALVAPEASWFHLGLLINPGGQRITLLINGMRLARHKLPPSAAQPVAQGAPGTNTSAQQGLFQMIPGTFTMGALEGEDSPGFRGWVDDLKVFAERPNLEVQCNHARGTLVGLPEGYTGSWAEIADAYPAVSHKRITHRLKLGAQASFTRYVCAVDYASDQGMNRLNLPEGTLGIREALLMPEAPLVFGAPRPDSSQNTFCLSCHVEDQPPELSPEALIADPRGLPLQLDARRQPSQAPRLIFGHIPAGYVGGVAPLTDEVASELGTYLDQWMHP